MICRECGARIPPELTRRRRFQCPACGHRYRHRRRRARLRRGLFLLLFILPLLFFIVRPRHSDAPVPEPEPEKSEWQTRFEETRSDAAAVLEEVINGCTLINDICLEYRENMPEIYFASFDIDILQGRMETIREQIRIIENRAFASDYLFDFSIVFVQENACVALVTFGASQWGYTVNRGGILRHYDNIEDIPDRLVALPGDRRRPILI